MWNFTEDGFTSVVEYDPPLTHWSKDEGKNVPFDDGIINRLPEDYHAADKETLSSHVLVRARIKEDLDKLKTYDPDAVETEDKLADYQFRLVMRRAAYAQYMYDKVMTLDYNSHVKETIDKRAPKVAGGRYSALSSIWSACARWQPNMPWGNTVNYGGYGTGSYKPATNANVTRSDGSYSYYDRSLGKWITKDKNNKTISSEKDYVAVGPGGASPKDGSVVRVDDADAAAGVKDEPWADQAWWDEQMAKAGDPDNPWVEPSDQLPLGTTEDGLNVTADATRATMIAQVKDIVQATGRTCEVEALVDELQETFGTVNIDTIPSDIITDMTEEYESVSTILAGM